MSNGLTQQRKKPVFSVAITTKGYQDLINQTLGNSERAKRFIAAITSAVAINPALQDCDAGTILAGGLLGESLGLSPSPQIGQYYLIPFECKVKDANGKNVYVLDENGTVLKDKDGRAIVQTEKKAQFVLGYKGYVQMAIRSERYRKLTVIEIKEGELRHYDPLNEEIDCILISDLDAREAASTVGYYAMFETVGGFRKAMYWTRHQMEAHADKYSPAFSMEAFHRLQRGEIPEKDMWKYSSFWYKNFDDMAKKTMLRQMISRWGELSTNLETAILNDNGIFAMNGPGNYIESSDQKLGSPDPEEPKLQEPDAPKSSTRTPSLEVKQVSLDEL